MIKTLSPSITDTIDHLPSEPGVYIFRDINDDPLYVGKSRCLRDRVRSYFRPTPRDRKMAHLRALTVSIDILRLNTDFQAMEVETDLIQSYRPPYNSLYLDYMHRPLVKITRNETYPQVEIVPEKEEPEARYFGPYRSTRRLRRILDVLGDCFQFRTCDYDIPAGGNTEQLERCHRALLDRCKAPCVGEDDPAAYGERMDRLVQFLEGNREPTLKVLRERMEKHADNHNYEAADMIKTQIEAIRHLDEYTPFIRRTLDANVYYMNEEHSAHGRITVRDHRVKTLRLSRGPIQPAEDPTASAPNKRRHLTLADCQSRLPFPVTPPETTEEQTLTDVLGTTVKQFSAIQHHDYSITDKINLREELVHRRVGEQSERITAPLRGRSQSGRKRMVEHYAHLIEDGVPVPNRIEASGNTTMKLSARGIIRESLQRITAEAPSDNESHTYDI